jgi:phosphoserine phosphatase
MIGQVSECDVMSSKNYLVCLDMDRVLVDHLSTWQFVYDQMGLSNDESFELYNQGLLNEWDWIKLDIALIKGSRDSSQKPVTDAELRGNMEGMPMMKNWRMLIQGLLDDGARVAIVSGGLQQTARDIAAQFASDEPWKRRWGGIDRFTSKRFADGKDTLLTVFTNGWLTGNQYGEDFLIGDFGRYQVQMNGKGSIVSMLQRRFNIDKSRTASVGDSAGDIGMFQESGYSICFNPWDDRPLDHCDEVVREKDLEIVLNKIKAKMLE